MQKFEYKLLDVPAIKGWWSIGGKVDFQELSNKLNVLGREGWEVVASTDLNRYHGESRNVMIILKRPLTDKE
ncbi:MAG: DUF4177 domain-containing protein [Chitinophagaceae bacterium]